MVESSRKKGDKMKDLETLNGLSFKEQAERFWTLTKLLTSHGIERSQFHLNKEGKLIINYYAYNNGRMIYLCDEINPSVRAVKDWLGY